MSFFASFYWDQSDITRSRDSSSNQSNCKIKFKCFGFNTKQPIKFKLIDFCIICDWVGMWVKDLKDSVILFLGFFCYFIFLTSFRNLIFWINDKNYEINKHFHWHELQNELKNYGKGINYYQILAMFSICTHKKKCFKRTVFCFTLLLLYSSSVIFIVFKSYF